jgi:uncharacterized repeat protein (TIGR01451 family)
LRAAGAAACALVVSGAAMVPAAAATDAAAARAAFATVPGKPGTPQPPTAVYTEDFSHQSATGAGIPLPSYTGAPGTSYVPGVSGASSQTYTGDPNWATGTMCDGWILNASTPQAGSCSSADWTGLKIMTAALGVLQGMTASAAAVNQALSEITDGNPGAGVLFQTSQPIAGVAGHFYQVTAGFSAANCNIGQPDMTFSLVVDGTVIPVGTHLNPCTDPGRIPYLNVVAASLKSSVLHVTGGSLGLQLYNANGSGAGNDAALDLPQIMDVTPQLDKSFSPGTITSGGTSELTFTVTNTNELAAKNGWSFTDDLPAGMTATGVNSTTCPAGTVTAGAGSPSVSVSGNLAQGETSCSVTVQVTALAAGSYTDGPGNFAAGTAGLNGLNPPGDTTLTVTPAASLVIAKQSSTTALPAAGTTVTYKFVVTNRSSVTLTGVSVTDAQEPPASQGNMSAVTCATTTLAPGDSTTCFGTYAVTAADVAHGSLQDSATASGSPPSGPVVTSPPSVLVIRESAPDISVAKSTTVTEATAVGQRVPYSFLVTNAGNVPLGGVTVTDTVAPPSDPAALSPVTCPDPALAAGAAETCTATYTVTQADLDNGSVNDSATASATAPDGSTVSSPPSPLSLPAQPPAALSVQKATTTTAVTAAGQQIPYTFTVTNNSPDTVDNITVTDTVAPPSLPGNLSAVSCPKTSLTAGEVMTCTATYTVTQPDTNHGEVSDTARADGTGSSGNPVHSGLSSVTLTLPAATISVVKAATVASVSEAGQQVPYTFTVTNTGNQQLTGVSVTDTQVAPASQGSMSAVTCPQPALAAGDSETCTGTYTVTQADLDNGSVNDYAVANAAGPNGAVNSTASSASVPVQSPPLAMVKSSPDDSYDHVGQQVSYRFTVSNLSTVTFTGIAVHDTQQPPAAQGGLSAISCPQPDLAAGESETCTATYTVTQADVDHGTLADTATVTGVDPAGATVTTPASSVILPAAQSPAITVVKSAPSAQVQKAGDVIGYRFAVTNAGNVTLTSVAVTDAQTAPAGNLDGPVTCPDTTLAPGASVTCTAAYTVTQADIDHGSVSDTATAAGSPPSGPPATSPPSAVTVPTPQAPEIAIVKSATPARVHAPGDVISYQFTVTNTGNNTLTSVAVTDAQAPPAGPLDGPVTCPDTTLAPGASTTCTAAYTVTQADINHGSVDDTATASGTPPSGPPVTSASAGVPVQAAQAAALSVVKSAAPAQVHKPGDVVSYRFLVTNTGNVPLTSVAVTDAQAAPAGPLDGPVSCPHTTLAPGASTTCTASYTVTQADIDDGGVHDTATASGTPPSGPAVTSASSPASVHAVQSPGLAVAKSGSAAPVTHAGQQVRYSFLVTDTGNVTMYKIKVTDVVAPPSDPASLSPVTCPVTTLAPGQSTTCTATYTVTQADMDHGGQLADSATVTGVRPATAGGPAAPPLPPSAPSGAVVPVVQAAGLRIVKSAATEQVAGDPAEVIRYQFTLANTGNLTLHDVGVSDPKLASEGITVRCPHPVLAPGKSETCTSTRPYVVSAADAARGSVSNTADAHARTPSGDLIRSAPSTITTTVSPLAALIPTGEGASAAPPGASPGLAGAGAAALSAGMVLLLLRRRRRA